MTEVKDIFECPFLTPEQRQNVVAVEKKCVLKFCPTPMPSTFHAFHWLSMIKLNLNFIASRSVPSRPEAFALKHVFAFLPSPISFPEKMVQ